MSRPRLYAHRGASALLPENTLAAFEAALEAGATALECDVHLTADGHIVVAHDADGIRMAGRHATIAASTLAEVQSWDVGWGFTDASGDRPHAGLGHRVPTLHELLDLAGDVPLNLDIKRAAPPMVEPLLALLRDRRAEARTLLASFATPTLRAVRAAGYGGPTGMSQGEVTRLVLAPRALLGSLPGDRVQIPRRTHGVQLARAGFIRKCHALGKAVDFWTIDDPEAARALLDLGADGVMTNDPAALAPVFAAV